MEILKLVGFAPLAHGRLRRHGSSACGASIRCATAIGILLAFAVVCVLSANANAESRTHNGTRFERKVGLPTVVHGVDDATLAHADRDQVPLNGTASASSAFEFTSGGENGVLRNGIESGKDHAATTWHALLMVLVALVGSTIISFGGWYRATFALKRAAENMRVVESEWQRRCTAVEMREQAAQLVIAKRVTAVTAQERERIHSSMRFFVSGPLVALVSLLEALDGASSRSARGSLVGKIQIAVRTCVSALEDMLAPSPVGTRTIALDESLMDVRELIDGVVALFSPTATQKGLHLSVSIDRSVASRIFADSARLGQIVFHLLSHAIRSSEGGLITVAVRAEPLNAGSQRIVICVRDVGVQGARSVQAELPWAPPTSESVDQALDDNESFALCRRLAQCMGGELVIASERGFGTCGTFSAAFAVEHLHAVAEANQSDHSMSTQQASACEVQTSLAEPLPERFDRSYLDALSEEGIDLHTFLSGWRQAINDDLKRMHELFDRNDLSGVRAVLHRLSGAVGLVGARSLAESLRGSSVPHSDLGAFLVEALARRTQSLVEQLDTAMDTPRSNLP